MRYSTTITITIDDRHVSVLLSILYQALFLGLISLFSIMSVENSDPLKNLNTIKELELESVTLTQKPKRVRVVRRASQGKSNKRTEKKDISVKSLLGNLTQKMKSKKSNKMKKVNTINQKGFDYKNMLEKQASDSSIKMAGDLNFDKDFGFAEDVKADKLVKDDKKYVDMSAAKLAVNELTPDYKNCYERTILVDKSLSVVAYFNVNVVRSKVVSSKVTLKGKGNAKSKRLLKECLEDATKNMDFGVKSITRPLKYERNFRI